MKRMGKLALIPVAVALVCGCKLGSSKDTLNRRTTYRIINPDGVSVERLGDGTSAQIRFTTQEQAYCEVFFFAQDPSGTPTESAPARLPCTGAPKSEFSETINALKAESVYNFGIFAWTEAGTKDKGEVLIVKERPDGSGALRNSDGTFAEILFARFNVPLRTVEIQKARLDPPLGPQAILTKAGSEFGCRPALDDVSGISRALVGKGGISNMAMRGFATGEATELDSRLTAVFNSLQFGNPEWEWTYKTTDRENVLVKIRPPGRLTAVEVSQKTRTGLSEVKLSDAEASIPLDPGYPLAIAWQWDNLPSTAFVRVRLGKGGETGSLECVFDPKAGRASIDVTGFSGLPSGKYSLVIELESLVFQGTTGWLARSVDWRSIKLEKA
ncbi:hypothetical protein EBZ80_01880 [bacterium]|nr:hypothetical protein [bacterium]